MMQELKMPASALAVAEYYRDFATHFVLDTQDGHYADAVRALGYTVMITNTVMHSLDHRRQLARELLAWLPG